jgi:hypothetical protein
MPPQIVKVTKPKVIGLNVPKAQSEDMNSKPFIWFQ